MNNSITDPSRLKKGQIILRTYDGKASQIGIIDFCSKKRVAIRWLSAFTISETRANQEPTTEFDHDIYTTLKKLLRGAGRTHYIVL